MFDCFCLHQPGDSVVDDHRNVPAETFANHRGPWSTVMTELGAVLLHQLHVGRVRYGPYLHRYALLINAIETALSMYALLTQAGWDHRLKWRPLWHIPKYLRINFALVVSLLTVYSNLAAIAGLLMVSLRDERQAPVILCSSYFLLQKHQSFLLWPYICLHLGTFVLELCYLVVGKNPSKLAWLRKHDPNVCPNEPARLCSWWSPLLVVLVGCNLSIVIAICMMAREVEAV